MKIAILSTISNYTWAGTEEVWAQFATKALAQNHQVYLAADRQVDQSQQVQALAQQGLQVAVRKPFRPTKLYILKEHFWSDMQAIYRWQPDILLINSGSLFDILNLPVLYQFCQKINCAKVFFCHFVAETLIPQNRDRLKEFLPLIDAWVFVSQHNKALAERQLAYHFPESKVIVNSSRFHIQESPKWSNTDTVNFGCVARIETLWKGQDVLLEVLSKPAWQEREWHLNLYGEGCDREYIDNLIASYNLKQRVTCHGYVRDIKTAWQDNHLMVLPSRGEGTPLAVLEAMMCGRPTVTTDVGGNREILEDGATGFIADTATPYSFGKALERAWQQQERWQEMGNLAQQKAQELTTADPSQQLLDYLIQLSK